MIKLPEAGKINFIIGIIFLFFTGFIFELNPAVPVLIITLFIYLRFSEKHSESKNCNPLYLGLLFILIVSCSYFVIVVENAPLYYIPFCVIPMLSVILFNELKVSLLLTLSAAMAAASIADRSLYWGLSFLISGICSMLLVYGARRRNVIIRTGFIIGLVQAGVFFLADGFKFRQAYNYPVFVVNGIACAIIVIGVLPVFEYLFKTVTNISLLELADFNHPLLQELTLNAPGTYHHSLIVGNLSDAACNAVGANALLARIGAYYHDIGKLSKPEYFSENQGVDSKMSKHEVLPASMSKLVIMNHVKEGVDLAKKHKLNPRIIDFIQEHHGNSLVYFFYRRALENSQETKEIKEEGFRYPGPKPKTKETAIVLLADSAEASTRTLKDHSPVDIETMVHKVINNKFIDGQLDECDLTLKELEKIAAVFIRILSGIYHSRVTYP